MKTVFQFIFISFLFFVSPQLVAQQSDLEIKLQKLAQQHSFAYSSLECETFFKEKYLLKVKQWLNPQDTTQGFFTQRVFLSHLDFAQPMVFVTEGYWAEYANNSMYVNELSTILNANQAVVEHRYFPPSVPDSIDWQYLTIENAAADHHRVVEILKQIYTSSWVNTGISKGGQTATYHRFLYPDDVDATVAYVAPLNFSLEEKRVYRHLEQVGDEETRTAILDFQSEMLKNKATYLPLFAERAKAENQTYSMGLEKGYELTVLEYSFAFWQWGSYTAKSIPKAKDGGKKMLDHLIAVSGLDWVSEQGIARMQPFFYQAMHQFGMYGYDISPFSQWVSFTENPTFEFTFPKGVEVKYNPQLHFEVDAWVRHQASNMMFVTGEWDPWGSTAVELSLDNNCVKFIKPQGSHRARILNLPKTQQEEAIALLKQWVGLE
jgi:hypothetical protein